MFRANISATRDSATAREDVLNTASESSEFSFFFLRSHTISERLLLSACVTEPTKAPSAPERDCVSLVASSIVMPHLLLSDTSSISLIDVPSDDEDDDSEVYQDSHSHLCALVLIPAINNAGGAAALAFKGGLCDWGCSVG
jgi:hypothetical protein